MTNKDQALVDSLREFLASIEAEKQAIEEKRESTIQYINRLTGNDGDSNGEASAPQRKQSKRPRRTRRPAVDRMNDIEDVIRKAGGKAEQLHIRKELDLDTGTTTRLVHRMQEEGRVKIKRDGRANEVSIARTTQVSPGESVEAGRANN